MNRYFTAEDLWNVNEHMKSCSTLLAVRKMRIKTTVRYQHYTPIRRSKQKSDIKPCKDAEKLYHLSIASGNAKVTATMKSSLGVSYQIKQALTIRSSSCTLGHLSV